MTIYIQQGEGSNTPRRSLSKTRPSQVHFFAEKSNKNKAPPPTLVHCNTRLSVGTKVRQVTGGGGYRRSGPLGPNRWNGDLGPTWRSGPSTPESYGLFWGLKHFENGWNFLHTFLTYTKFTFLQKKKTTNPVQQWSEENTADDQYKEPMRYTMII